MSENNNTEVTKCSCRERGGVISRIHTGYGIFLAIVVVAVAVCFAVSCISIYRDGGSSPFTPESISAHFNKIAIPTYISIAALIIGAIIAIVMPEKESELGKIYNPYIPLRALGSRLKLSECDGELADDIRKERKFRILIRVLCAVICIALFGAALLFSLDFSRFSATDVNREVLGCVLISLPLSLGALVLIFAAAMINSASAVRELEITKWAISRRKSALMPKKEEKESRLGSVSVNIFRVIVLGVGIAFVILGINNGGMEQVLGKAVRICTECIGLG